MAKTRHNFGLTRNAAGPNIPVAINEYAFRKEEGFRFLHAKGDNLYSFEMLDQEMHKRGRQLLDMGLKKGDKLALVLPEPEDFVLMFIAAMSVGVVPVPMYPPLSFGKLDSYIDSSARIIEASESKVLLTDKKVQNILWSLVDRVATLEGVVTVESLAAPKTPHPGLDHIVDEDVAFFQFTSGSTSHPKGVVVTHGSLLANLDGIMNVGLEIDDDDIAVSWLPLYHDMGLIGFMLAPIWYGVPTIYMPPTMFIKRPSRWMETINKYNGTIAFAPNFAFALAEKRTKPEVVAEMDLSKMKCLGCGAEPNHPGTLNSFLDHFAPAGLAREALLPCYGMAEATLAMAFVPLEDQMPVDRVDQESYQKDKIAKAANGDSEGVLEFVSCGRTFPNHELIVVDEDLNEVPERHIGQIVFRGPSVAAGYYKEPEKTAEVFTDTGLLTGDLGYALGNHVYVTSRIKDVVILNGRNYDPQSIEWVVQEVEGIRKGNVVAFSIRAERTEELVIVAETKSDEDLVALAEAVAKAVRAELMVSPSEVALVGRGQLPKTSSGKLQRAKTRDQFLAGQLGKEGARTMDAETPKATLAKHVAKSAVSRVKHGVKSRVKKTLRRP